MQVYDDGTIARILVERRAVGRRRHRGRGAGRGRRERSRISPSSRVTAATSAALREVSASSGGRCNVRTSRVRAGDGAAPPRPPLAVEPADRRTHASAPSPVRSGRRRTASTSARSRGHRPKSGGSSSGTSSKRLSRRHERRRRRAAVGPRCTLRAGDDRGGTRVPTDPIGDAGRRSSVSWPPSPGLEAADRVPLSSMRQTIARRLVESKTTIPHYQVTMTFDMDPLLELRRSAQRAARTTRASSSA